MSITADIRSTVTDLRSSVATCTPSRPGTNW